MGNQPWLEELRARLSQQGLPRSYVERLVEEMSDHANDIMEEERGMEAREVRSAADRLGQPTELAQAAMAEYRKWSFGQRHPVLTFIVLPVPLMVALWAVFIILAFGIGYLFRHQIRAAIGDDPTRILPLPLPLHLMVHGMMLAPFAISAMIFCRLATWSGRHWGWSMLSCGILGVVGCFIGLGEPSPFFGGTVNLTSIFMVGMPLGIGVWYSWLRIKKQRRSLVMS